MTANPEKIKSNYAQILIPFIGVLIIISWMFLIVPDLKNDSSTFEGNVERMSESAKVEKIGDPLPAPTPSRLTLKSEIINTDGNIMKIQSVFRDNGISTDKIIWEHIDVYYVDKNTRKHKDSESFYNSLPYNTQKQDYLLYHPLIGNTTPLYFEGTEVIGDVEMYIFSCIDLDGDRTSTYPQFAPETIHSDHTCLAYFEPITGEVFSGAATWYNYVIRDGVRIPVDVGKSDTSSFTKDVRLKALKDKIELFQFYDTVIPTFLLLTLGAVFSTSVYNKKSKEKGKIIKKQFEELKQADKTKTLFLNNLTHELKTPLVPIQGNLEMLKNPKMGELNEMQKESIDEIYEHSTYLLNTVENFLKLQKITENKLELNIQEIKMVELEDIVSKIIPENSKIKIDIKLDQGLLINADKNKLIEIITELVKNTTDFLPEQGGKIEITSKEQKRNVVFSVKDNGIGIPKEKLTNIFKPFIKADMSQSRIHSGVGLGLAICKGYVEGMNGKIWVESEEGKGTTFFFTIPKAE
jgi:signal transduction histidine kinase